MHATSPLRGLHTGVHYIAQGRYLEYLDISNAAYSFPRLSYGTQLSFAVF